MKHQIIGYDGSIQSYIYYCNQCHPDKYISDLEILECPRHDFRKCYEVYFNRKHLIDKIEIIRKLIND